MIKGESVTFRATTQSVLATLNQCIDIINQRDEYFRKKMDTEMERRRQSEDMCKWVYFLLLANNLNMVEINLVIHRKLKDELNKTKSATFFGPDSEVSNGGRSNANNTPTGLYSIHSYKLCEPLKFKINQKKKNHKQWAI